jgi:hypothetical protein
MTKKKDVVQKFKTFFLNLDNEERRTLYDLLSCIRGPDIESKCFKKIVTARIRFLLGVTRHNIPNGETGISNTLKYFSPSYSAIEFSTLKNTLTEFKLLDSGEDRFERHYEAHLVAALEHLNAMGYMGKEKK